MLKASRQTKVVAPPPPPKKKCENRRQNTAGKKLSWFFAGSTDRGRV